MTYDDFVKNLEQSVPNLLDFGSTHRDSAVDYTNRNAKFVLDEVATTIGVSGADSDFLLELDGICYLATLGICYYYKLTKMPSQEGYDAVNHYFDRYERSLVSLKQQIEQVIGTCP
ncbi:MAG: hypothetical protein UT24_C0018G0004 [Candidatus Woesebacteria bacterium GW2011_GWB1_39_12]|uniref:Uncharacterized protein n=1 Tax=Candidatus Woesebacteria bacterium GW2011_GWB1_39_12 TaxID=1618574 RepID=A0A0G0QE69_9BACT|nr:MAG: hypothetical protein UT24_C0018G0004 [Candidatus Woesebacteria bacterium GW2011_GWB1_39_12]